MRPSIAELRRSPSFFATWLREIAEILGITENNAAVRLSRARAALRTALEER